jgi:hypothetical protein
MLENSFNTLGIMINSEESIPIRFLFSYFTTLEHCLVPYSYCRHVSSRSTDFVVMIDNKEANASGK